MILIVLSIVLGVLLRLAFPRFTRKRDVQLTCRLLALCCLALGCCACGPISALFTTVLAVLGGVSVMLTTLGTAIPNPVVVAITAAVNVAITAVQALEQTVDAYEADNTGTGLVAKIRAGIQAVQQTLSSLEIAAHIDNATVQAWILKVTGLVAALFTDIVNDILPATTSALLKASMGDSSGLPPLSDKIKALTAQFRADHETALLASGLSTEAIDAVKTHVDHACARHVGPVRI